MGYSAESSLRGVTGHGKSAPLPDRSYLERGFTLVEMLIASLVFTVAIVSLMSMVLFALAARYSSRIDSAALKLSQQKLEELKVALPGACCALHFREPSRSQRED